MSQVHCYYHKNCIDGMGAAWSIYKHRPEAVCHSIDYDNDMVVPAEVDDATVFVVDFSFTPETMDKVIQKAHAFTLLDHHPRTDTYIREMVRSRRYEAWGYILSSYSYDAEWIQVVLTRGNGSEDMRNMVHLEYDLHRSGAQMAWEHMSGATFNVPKIIRHMSDYDRWKFELPDTHDVIAGLGQYPIDLEVYSTFMDDPALTETLIQQAPALIRMRQTLVDEIIGTTQRMITFEGQEVPLINCPKPFTSQAVGQLSASYPFAMGYYDIADSRVFSLRSRKKGGETVNAIAKLYGGNGHEHAAGFFVPRTTPNPKLQALLLL